MIPATVPVTGFMCVIRRALSVRGIAIVLIALGYMGMTGCVSVDEHKRLQVAFDQARQQLAEAENDLANARARITELEGKIAELNKLLDASSGGVGAIKRERDSLYAQLADLQKRYEELLKLNAGTPVLPADVNAALRNLAAQYPDLLEFDERLGMIRFKSDLTFDLGSTEVKPQAKAALASFAKILNMSDIAKNEISVVGHTDNVPIKAGGPTAVRNPDNWTLSTNRAWAVLAVLRANGLSEARGMGSGWGDQRPIAPNAAGGSEKNRRVDIYIRPTTVPEGIVVGTPSTPTGTPVRRVATRPATRPATPRVVPAPVVPIPMPG